MTNEIAVSGGDDEVVDAPDLLLLLVIDRLAKDLFLRTPSDRHRPHLLDGDTKPGRLTMPRGLSIGSLRFVKPTLH
jgi:hypothetical protein